MEERSKSRQNKIRRVFAFVLKFKRISKKRWSRAAPANWKVRTAFEHCGNWGCWKGDNQNDTKKNIVAEISSTGSANSEKMAKVK